MLVGTLTYLTVPVDRERRWCADGLACHQVVLTAFLQRLGQQDSHRFHILNSYLG